MAGCSSCRYSGTSLRLGIEVSIYRLRREATTRRSFAIRFGSASNDRRNPPGSSPACLAIDGREDVRGSRSKVAVVREIDRSELSRREGRAWAKWGNPSSVARRWTASVNCYVNLADTSCALLWGQRDRELPACDEEAAFRGVEVSGICYIGENAVVLIEARLIVSEWTFLIW